MRCPGLPRAACRCIHEQESQDADPMQTPDHAFRPHRLSSRGGEWSEPESAGCSNGAFKNPIHITIGAGDDNLDHKVDAAINRQRDVKKGKSIQNLSIEENENQQIINLLTKYSLFKNNWNDRLIYKVFPGPNPVIGDSYNSNSFTRGVLLAAGFGDVPVPIIPDDNPGWEWYIPLIYFQ
jgi:hypothetical protein